MKRLCGIIIALAAILGLHAEKRIYFFRAQDLPSDVQTLDLRSGQGLAQLSLDNIYQDEEAPYALFTKRADSWWQVMVETAKGRTVDLSEVNDTWYLKLKIRRTVDYSLTLVLAGAGTANGYPLPVSKVPANGEWTELAIPLSDFPVMPAFTEKYAGRLLQIHSDLGYAGDLIGIDYCYLTNDPSGKDEGTVQAPKRCYFITNSRTPLNGTPYITEDYSGMMDIHADGWQQWSYIPFPYYSMEADMPVKMQLLHQETAPQIAGLNPEWYLVAQIRTDVQGAFVCRLFLPEGRAYADTLGADEWARDGRTWNRLCLQLDRMKHYTYTGSTPVFFSLSSLAHATAGEWSMASLMLTNDNTAADPEPLVPADPSQETRVYLLNDGSPLPEDRNCIDYRLDKTDYLSVSFGNNTTRKASDSFLTLLPTNGWWSADIAAKTPVDLTMVDATWTMHTRVRTTSAFRPVNLILYKEGNAQLARYQLTEDMLPVAQNGTWFDYDIPMSAFMTEPATLINYTSRIFSFHSDNGGTAGVEVSMEYLYFSHEGESKPDPVPGQPTVSEPDLAPSTEGFFDAWGTERPKKLIRGNRLIIQTGDNTYDVYGRKL